MRPVADYPSRPVRYIVPFGAGPTTVQANWLAERLGIFLGQPVIVENAPGASGTVGTALVAKADPDGYVLLAANPGPLVVGPHVRHDLGYDPVASFFPIILLATVPGVIAIHPDMPVRNMVEFISLARAKPGHVRYGSPGMGTVGHLAMELLQHLAAIRLKHVPGVGLSEAAEDLVAGAFDALIMPVPDARPLAAAGRIRVLATTWREKISSWPELPAANESGVPGFESFNWNGVAAPAGTPPDIISKINSAVNSVLRSSEAAAYFGGKGYEIIGGTPQAFGDFLATETNKWRKATRLAGLMQ